MGPNFIINEVIIMHIILTDTSQLKQLKRHDSFEATCEKCGTKYQVTDFRPERLDRYNHILCQPCYAKMLKLERYGDPNYNNRDKSKTTCIEKYGVENPHQNKDIIAKCENTCLEKYGVTNPNKTKEVRDKINKTNLERYGVTCSLRNEEVHKKVLNSMNERYGVNYTAESELLRNKMYDTSVNSHNGVYHSRTEEFKKFMHEQNKLHPEWQEKGEKIQRKAHKGLMYTQTNEFKTFMSEQNRLHPEWQENAQSKRIFYYGLSFDSIPEFAVYLYCTYFGIPIIRNYSIWFDYIDIKGVSHKAFPDFIINGKLVEIKGGHFFKEDGTMYLPYRNKEWSDEEYKYQSSIHESKRQCLIKNNVLIYKNTDPWVAGCVSWLESNINISLYVKSNPLNICYGYSPFNINSKDKYCPVEGLGLSPFDLLK